MMTATSNPPPSATMIRAALRDVLDPEVGINIVDLGMIGEVVILSGGAVQVMVRPTTRGCPMHEALALGVTRVVGALPGVGSVEVQFSYEPPWTPEFISAEARALLGWR